MTPPITSFRGPYRFLSNFHPCLIKRDGLTFSSVEHAYQAAKSLDPAVRAEFTESIPPGAAKRRGRRVKLRPDWEEVKLDVMLGLLRRKFTQLDLRRQLLATGDAELIEDNDWGDHFWGVCMGVGENHLGKLLMQVRGEW